MRLAWALAGAAIVACSAQQAPVGSHGVQTPIGSDGGTALSKAVPVVIKDEISIAEFQPLMAEPVLARAQKQVEAGNHAAAAREVEAQMGKVEASPKNVARFQMLLGRLRELSGDLKGAQASYELAAQERWPLSGYATLAAGRVMLRAGKTEQAIGQFERVPKDQPIALDSRLLLAEAALKAGKRDTAIDAWRAHLATRPPQATDFALRLAALLLDRASGGAGDGALADQREALGLARRSAAENAAAVPILDRARKLEKRALDALPPAERQRLSRPTREEELLRLKALVEAKLEAEAEKTADALIASLDKSERWNAQGCEASFWRAKAISLKRESARSAEAFDEVVGHCKSDDDLLARALFLAGKQAAADGRQMQAVQRYTELEKLLPKHRLADDARMGAALAYFELGVEARFTELLSTIMDDYPEGDVVLDAVFRLALRRIEKGDWSGAANVLDKVAATIAKNDSARGTEHSGRERYFLARAWIETGDAARGFAELEAIVRELPLSYYMLHAWSRLVERDPARAKQVLEEAEKKAATQPFSIEHQPEFDTPGFSRAMELLRQGELDQARREVEALGIAKPGATPRFLWALSLLYSRAGSARDAHVIARGMLTDWLGRWPAGDWAKAWQLAYPRPYRAIVQRETKKNGVPESLVYAVMREESAFDPNAVSPADAYGLMQLIVPTAKLIAKPTGLPSDPASLKQPSVNIALGTRGLSELTQKTFAENSLLAIPGYNAGPGRPRRWLRERPRAELDLWVELIPITETRRYTKRVLASRAAYAYLYEKERAAEAMALPVRLD
ncbi:MAG: transglycosylase SLT domain-containing protein [Myxococcales bacterium]|nr:transglycosylase SLT domain-containing protein [Myxococcales bacterium]